MISVEGKIMWFAPHELRALDLRRGDLLVVEGGAGYGRPALIRGDFSGWGFQNHINRVRSIEGLSDTRFLYYVLEHLLSSGITAAVAAGATIPTLSAEKVRGLVLDIPSLADQRRIADFLDRETAQIDTMVEAQRDLAERLEERRKVVVWRGVTKGVGSPRVQPSGVEWIGDLPAGWSVARLKNSIESIQTGTWGDEPQSDETDVRCVRVADFDRRHLGVVEDDATVRSVPGRDQHRLGLKRGDLLLEKSGGTARNPVGFVVMYDSDEPAVCSNFIGRMRVRSDQNPRYWLYAHAASYMFRLTHRSLNQTTGIQNLDVASYLNERFPYPPRADQDSVAEELDRVTAHIDAMIDAANAAVALLQERRAALISAAVTGRVDPRSGVEGPGGPEERGKK